MTSTIDKKELEKLLKNLESLPEVIQQRVANGAVRAGAKEVQQAAIDYAPLETGTLRDSIIVRKSTKKQQRKEGDDPKEVTSYLVGINTSLCSYANVVEFGSIKMPPDPFMTPAFENVGNSAINAMKNYLKKRIEKEIAKASK